MLKMLQHDSDGHSSFWFFAHYQELCVIVISARNKITGKLVNHTDLMSLKQLQQNCTNKK